MVWRSDREEAAVVVAEEASRTGEPASARRARADHGPEAWGSRTAAEGANFATKWFINSTHTPVSSLLSS